MHPDAAALERAVLADPCEATPRLAYADWLDEHDDPEFAAALREPEAAAFAQFAAAQKCDLRAAWQTAVRMAALLAGVGKLATAMRSTLGPAFESLANGFREFGERTVAVLTAIPVQPADPAVEGAA